VRSDVALDPVFWPHLLVGFVASSAAFFVPAIVAYYLGHSSVALLFGALGGALFLWCIVQVVRGRGGFPRAFIAIGTAVGMVLSVFVSSCLG
jgi:hypothetical protein